MNDGAFDRDLFGDVAPCEYPDAPGHRGVETSIAAALAIAPKLGRLQAMARQAIEQAGWNGLTADELAERLGCGRYTIQPRTSELRRKGVIIDSGKRRANASGKRAIVWVAACFTQELAA